MKQSLTCMNKSKVRQIAAVCGLLLLWQFASSMLHNDLLLPSPAAALESLLKILSDPASYEAILRTLYRVGKGLVLSFILALVLVILVERKPVFRDYLHPFVVITSSIPNVSYMILAIIWLGNEGSVTAVTMLVLFPVLFSGLYTAVAEESQALRDVEALYPETFFYALRYRLVPMLYLSGLRTLKTAAQLGFKVGVMAEILGAVRAGVGRQIHFADLNLDTASVLAWTVIIIILSWMISALIELMIQHRVKYEKTAGIKPADQGLTAK